ncbi:DUF2388 domain-containing protein [Pseudomonas faucium]|uniref:DUF2388 domain-containing protein n=1 Tax=Pseudomonas faucium TaxID=2740518 RepID=UPI001596C3E0|nr:DUF2388 domain-containing protein [Pseudomonas faucium]
MRDICISSVYFLLLFSAPAMAINDFWAETLISSTSTATTYLTSRDRKLIAATQDDASAFVASDGDIKGAYLEAAMDKFRTSHPELNISDMALAQIILIYNQDN